VHENRIYSLKICCDEHYPDRPPTIQFVSRVNLPFVSQSDGKVDPTKLAVLANWSRNNSIETVLVEIRRFVTIPPYHPFLNLLSDFSFIFNFYRREMASFNNRKLPQPPEGSTF
jgi:ubiquitin-conjugating enzyme E2 variant